MLHAWCGAHLLRDLRGIHEADTEGQLWARAMAHTLLEANRIAAAVRGGVGELSDVAGAEFSSGTGSGCRQGVDVSIFGAVRPSH